VRLADEHMGLQATLLRITWEELLRQKQPCVVHLANDHFVAVDPREQNPEKVGAVQVFDVDGTAFWWDEAEMTKRWSDGAVLLLAPPANSESPVYVNNCWQNFGILVNEPTVTCSFDIENRSDQELKLAVVDKSCGCTTATPNEQIIPAGGVGTVECEVRLGDRKGLVSEKVVVEATGPVTRRMSLYFSGDVFNGPAVIPQYSNLGPIMRGDKRTFDVIIRGTRAGDPLTVEDVHISETSREVKADLTWEVEYLRDIPRENATRWPHAGPYDAVVHVQITAAKDSPAASFGRKLEFVTNLPKESDPTVVQLSGQVTPAIEYSPKALIVRATDNKSAELHLRALDSASPLSISSVELQNLPGLMVIETDSSLPLERRYTVEIEEGASLDQGRAGFLAIELEEGAKIRVPVACLVSSTN
ncbi:MAG: DUF1573 domain-containing protein, partial [Planctomycetaceae bacterium]|nr:DUF1573 domain-containing protein [Planctomycetaceae bacterium]